MGEVGGGEAGMPQGVVTRLEPLDQIGFSQGLRRRAVDPGGCGAFEIFGDDAFGQILGAGDLFQR
jgi:hypothetical protein